MITRQLYGINDYNKNSFIHSHTFFLSKSKRIEIEEKIQTYFSSHPLVLWAAIFIGVPMGILFAVGLAATIFGLMILGIISFM